jgi:hypothetical protein
MNIAQLVQKSVVAFLSGAGIVSVTRFYRGIEGADTSAITTEEANMQLPCVVVDTSPGQPNVLFSGNWTVPVSVRVRTQCDDETEATHHARAQEVFGYLSTTTIAADLSGALSNFTAFLVRPTQAQAEPSSRHFESVYAMDVICCPSDIS